MKEAMLYEGLDERKVRCSLCAHRCIISDGKRGICAVRENRGGKLYSLSYGKIIALHVDPVEKKPLFHFLPGSTSLSLATAGCNFHCTHCQNFDISQYPREHEGDIPGQFATPESVVDAAELMKCGSISYTYTEPTIFFEFAFECAKLARARGIKNIFVSNGYSSPEATRLIAPYLDGNNIDLKGNDDFYRKICGARLEPVKETIRLMKQLGVWIEITTLIIPDHNDSEKDLRDIAGFIKSVDVSVPWHVTQFYPTYKLTDEPRTPAAKLNKAREIGFEAGLKYIYVGNIPGKGGEDTCCPNCKELLIERFGFTVTVNRVRDGKCFKCGRDIEGIWK
jgi:pyruvate formate lyase activating enzyme